MLRDVFQFWGYPKSDYDRLVGPGQCIEVHCGGRPTALFGRIEAAKPLADHFGSLADLCSRGWWSWLILEPEQRPTGEPLAWLTTDEGDRRPMVTRDDGGWHFWFDVDATVTHVQNERYFQLRKPVYLSLGINPDRLPSWCRRVGYRCLRKVSRIGRGAPARFPNYPFDVAVDGWRFVVRSLIEEHTEVEAMPLWPEGKRFAVVLNHDVDTAHCFKYLEVLRQFREAEEQLGMRSAWMIVSKLLPAGRNVLDALHEAGHEIGFHDTEHDHRLAFLEPQEIADRIEQASELRERYGAIGFRSPNYLRTPALYEALDGRFEYDMSMHPVVSSGGESASQGCSTCFPFRIEGTEVFEIPTTVPEDFFLEEAGMSPDEALRTQLSAVEHIRERGGVANILTHPEPGMSARPEWIEVYRQLLTHIASDSSAWVARPCDLNRHWRERQAKIEAMWSAGAGGAEAESDAERDAGVLVGGSAG